MRSTSARRAEASFCSPESGRWCCSARESGRRRCWRCCTRWRRPARHGRSCGCTALAIGSIIRLPPKSAASCSRSRTAAAMSVTAGRARDDTMGEDFDAAGHLSRSVFDEVGVPREADVYLCGPTRFMADMKEALASLGRGAGADSRRTLQRQRVDDSRCRRRRDASAASARRTTPTPVRWCRSRAAASPRTGRHRPTRASWSWPRRATSRSAGRAGPVCVTTVRAGWFRARSPTDPEPLDKPADGNLLVCCSQPIRDVVIDL